MFSSILFSKEIREQCPRLQLGCLRARISVAPSGPDLLRLIGAETTRIAAGLDLEQVSSLPVIRATRDAYKTLGKKPGRYRPSAEALLRRIVSGKGLYRIHNAVDLLNLCSATTGYSIGGYDAARIQGTAVLGIGREGEPYDAIARGELNIAHLPLFRDDLGPFGSPTSDSVRTMITQETKELLMVFFNFDGRPGLQELLQQASAWYGQFCQAREVKIWLQEA